MTDETPNPTTPEPPNPTPGPSPQSALPHVPERPPSSADTRPRRPEYRGEELDPERGPGLGCFWFQVIVLGFFIVLIPIGLNLNWPFELLAILLFVVLGLLLLTGQTVIFLLRLVAADRRAQGRRRPLASPTKTVGELEDAHRVAHAVGGAWPARAYVPGAAAAGVPASQAVIHDEEVLGTPAAGDLGAESEGESDAGDASGAPARTTEGDAAAPDDVAGDGEGPLAAPADAAAADAADAAPADAAAADAADAAPADAAAAAAPAAAPADAAAAAAPAAAAARAAADEAGPGEVHEEPDPGVRQ